MQIQDLEKSGFIHLPNHCSATIGKHQLRKRGGTLRRVSVDQKKKLLIQQGTSDSAVATAEATVSQYRLWTLSQSPEFRAVHKTPIGALV